VHKSKVEYPRYLIGNMENWRRLVNFPNYSFLEKTFIGEDAD
jgi:hypothetical protein